jgi:hypothetical protein
LVRICFVIWVWWVVLTRKASLTLEVSFLFRICYFPIWFSSVDFKSHKDCSQFLFSTWVFNQSIKFIFQIPLPGKGATFATYHTK